jgi:hypothetical protein
VYNIKFIVVTKFESVFKERNNENLITENLKYFVMYVGYHTLVKKIMISNYYLFFVN